MLRRYLTVPCLAALAGTASVGCTQPAGQVDAGPGSTGSSSGSTTGGGAAGVGGNLNVDAGKPEPALCQCEDADYWLEVLGDGEPQKFKLPYALPLGQAFGYSCASPAPYLITDLGLDSAHAHHFMAACATASNSTSCIFAHNSPSSPDDNPSPYYPSAHYLDRTGILWKLSTAVIDIHDLSVSPDGGKPPGLALGKLATGTFSAVGSSPDGGATTLTGSVQLCVVDVSLIPR
ncbi:MAG: hypothetical protein HY744_23570 [Deltaproteobacteria bacterium]|nr:hypothetical protein [Deltaproteobacteria bacterium]